MKDIILSIIIIIVTLQAVSCEKNKQVVTQMVEELQNEIIQEEAPQSIPDPAPEKQVKPIYQGNYSIINGSIYYEPSDEKKEWFRRQRETALEATVSEQTGEADYLIFDILNPNNIQKDFSVYEIHPLEIFLGEWRRLDYYGNKHERESYITIYKDGTEYGYNYNYGSSTETGLLQFMINGAKVFMRYRDSEYIVSGRIIGDPFKMNNSLAFHLFNEGPIGNFQLETAAGNDFSAWPVEYVNGSWIGQYELIDGTPIEKKQFSWGRGFSLPGISTEFDLGREALIIPGFGE